jgi:hypothetical protein
MGASLAEGHSPAVLAWAESWRQQNFQQSQPPVVHRAMPWSCVSRLVTERGTYYLKEMAPLFACEPAVITRLAQHSAELVPQIVASNPEQHCFIMANAGEPLRAHLLRHYDLDTATTALTSYARLQLATVSIIEDFLADGAQDWRLSQLPRHYENLLAQEALLKADGLDSQEREEREELRQGSKVFAELCRRLGDFGLPDSIEHGDFHDNNLLVQSGRCIVNDWGDTAIAPPFLSLARFMRSAMRVHALPTDGQQVKVLIDAYLLPWQAFAHSLELSTAYAIVAKISPIVIAHSLTRIWQCPGAETAGDEVRGAIASSLRDYLVQASP